MKPHERKQQQRREVAPSDSWADALIAKMMSACHGWQVDLIEDPHRRVSALVGRGGGKTTALCIRGVKKCLKHRRGTVLYFATTRQRAKELIWYPLKDLCDRLGLESGKDVFFNETELRCTFARTGSAYQLSGMDDLAAIEKWRGSTYMEVQIDEGASHRHELLDMLLYQVVGPRAKVILIVGTAGHIKSGTFYDATRPGSDKHRAYSERHIVAERRAWSSHHWTLRMVFDLPDAAKKYPAMVELWLERLQEFADNKWTDEHPVRKREDEAIWAEDETAMIFQYRARLEDGTAWNEWDPPRDELGPDRVSIARLPEGGDWLYALVMDHGAVDRFALNVFAASPTDPDRRIYHLYCFERAGMYAREIAILMLGPQAATDIDAAHAKPGGIIGAIGWPAGMESDSKALGGNILAELSNVYGLAVGPADQDGKLSGIELCNGDLVDGKIKILKGSALASQLANLQWKRDKYGFPGEDKGQANHCLVAGTMVMTENGERAIESVAVGDMVWTRSGLRRVTFSGQTGIRETVSVTLPDGRELRGTPDHRVLTSDGWMPLALLTADATYVSWASTDRALQSYSTGRSTVAIQRPPTRPCGVTSLHRMASSCTELFGHIRTDLFLQGCMSIIAMATTPTTTWSTSRPSARRSISVFTVDHRNGPRYLETVFSDSRTQQPQRGTVVRTALNGIAVTLPIRSTSRSISCVTCAARDSLHAVPERSAVVTSANDSHITRTCAVFDISVEGEPEFYANGVLVSNSSDCLIYGRRLLASLFDNIGATHEPPPKHRRDPFEDAAATDPATFGGGEYDLLFGGDDSVTFTR